MTLAKLYALVATAFAETNDKGGRPYFEHCLSVMKGLPECADEATKQAALAHDIIEDIEGGKDMLLSNGMSLDAVQLVLNVSKIKGESMESYKQRVKSDIRSVYIKMSDLRHNSDIRRLKGVGPKDIIRAIEYQAFYQELKDHVISYHKGV